MSHRSIILDEELREELELLARQQGCELLSVDLSQGALRIVLDRQDGTVGIDDCTTVSRQASALLDAHDFGDQRYTLEVSSPGLDRPLLKPRDYRRFAGQLARVTFRDPETDAKRTVVGRFEFIENIDPTEQQLRMVDDHSDGVSTIALDRILAARLEIDL